MRKIIIMAVIALGLAIRLIRLDQPLSEFATRQVETAMVARNFYYHGVKLFSPEMDLVGEKGVRGIFALELGLVPLLVAILYKISGGVHEYLGRLLSISFWLAAAYIYYRWLGLFSKRLALWGVIIFSFLPLSIILSRTFQPEMAMLFFSIAGLYCLTKYSLGRSRFYLWLGAISVATATLLKITAASLLFPLAFLYFKREKKLGRVFWLIILFVLSPALAWYSRGFLVSQIYPSELNAGNWALANWCNFSQWFVPENWRNIFNNLWGIVLTPLGFSLFLLGIFFKKNNPLEFLFYYWLLGILIFMALFFFHARTHVYYWLPLLPLGAYFIAGALVVLSDSGIGALMGKNIFAGKMVLALAIGAMLFYFVYPAYRVPRAYGQAQNVARVLRELTPSNSLVIASCSAGPYFLYYCQRRGWDLWINNPEINIIKRIEYLREQGGAYFASANMAELNKNKRLRDYLYQTYKLVWEEKGIGVIFALR